MFNQLKGYLYAVGAAILVILAAVFKYRGNKIESLEDELEVADSNAKVTTKVHEREIENVEFEAVNKAAAAKAQIKDIKDVEDRFYNI